MPKNVVVIGGGPGGYSAALRASQLGAEVLLVERGSIGGTCLNVGCIPTKSLLHSSFVWSSERSLFQKSEKSEVPWNIIMNRKNQAVLKLREGVEGLLRAGKVKVINGTAALTGESTVRVAGEKPITLEPDVIVLATGSRPIRPSIPGMDRPGVVTSDELLNITSLPRRLVIIGGGVIGVEFATIFAELGVKVEVVEAAPHILPNWDEDISVALQKHLETQHVNFHSGQTVERITGDENCPSVHLNDGEIITADLVLIAVGREADLEQLDLEAAGVKLNGRKIAVNDFQQTNRPSIYAVGDCCSPMMLAHVAIAEAIVAVEHALGEAPQPVAYEAIPQCVYTHPEAAMVGLSIKEARARGFDVITGTFPLEANGRALVEGETTGLIKIVSETRYGRVLGAHILAPHATEMIAAVALSITLEATTDELMNTVFPHPTVAEGIHEAVLAGYGKAIHIPNRK